MSLVRTPFGISLGLHNSGPNNSLTIITKAENTKQYGEAIETIDPDRKMGLARHKAWKK